MIDPSYHGMELVLDAQVKVFFGMSPVGRFSQGKKANRLRRGAPAVVDRRCKKVMIMVMMEK